MTTLATKIIDKLVFVVKTLRLHYVILAVLLGVIYTIYVIAKVIARPSKSAQEYLKGLLNKSTIRYLERGPDLAINKLRACEFYFGYASRDEKLIKIWTDNNLWDECYFKLGAERASKDRPLKNAHKLSLDI